MGRGQMVFVSNGCMPHGHQVIRIHGFCLKRFFRHSAAVSAIFKGYVFCRDCKKKFRMVKS